MIHLSQAAIIEIGRLKSKQQADSWLRLAIKEGGCSGWFYEMSFDQVVTSNDRVFDVSGIQVLIDEESLNYVNGLALDYSEDLMGGGFRFHNPQSIGTCGCGISFSIIAPKV
ncbi:HesB/IscA family protein [Anabaenopsis elenkinii]|uniref:Iron-sulfur cluster assembly accessory protein n=1 Tax=Anabaenopsis elenkinii CCIBt3563 TaxID=2779889 RepID=A0A7S6U703_9CYAN|nr:iron-sulfur cluster assembly accessory protein [Anabaenopsis elenkinii]QOV24253.1 iron-sulfur cluster assembly accessory protein [Anabaenopsis elenkinii CCIBt3563]